MGMIKNVIKRVARTFGVVHPLQENGAKPTNVSFSMHELSLAQVTKLLSKIPYFEDKINLVALYQLDHSNGRYTLKSEIEVAEKLNKILFKNHLAESKIAELLAGIDRDINEETPNVCAKLQRFDKIHFACGGNYLDDWLNIDFANREQANYLRLNLCERLPFPDGHFKFGFAEDFLEHLGQDDSIIFLAEAYRSLQKGGVLRLSFPGLEGVLNKHYLFDQALTTYAGKLDAYLYWDHFHFYSMDELRTVAKHIGFCGIEFVKFGESKHQKLCGLDTREHQKDLNTYVELTK